MTITTVIETDNRDMTTTTLTLSNGLKVDVDPVDLFKNMLENLGPEGEKAADIYVDPWLELISEKGA